MVHMPKFYDLTGQRFGRLVVLERCAPPHPCKGGNVWYLCKCDCGNLKAFRAPSLKSGNALSCGCLRAELDKGGDYTGVRRGCFTGVKNTGIRGADRGYIWEWRCDCGNLVYSTPKHIGKKGGITRCAQCRARFLKEQASTISTSHRLDNGMMRGNLLALLDGKPLSTNSTGVRGVYYNKKLRKYGATVRKDGKRKHLGYYATLEEAAEVRAKAVLEVYGSKEDYIK